MGVTLLVLTLNEEQGMKAIMPRVDRTLFEQIIVVDGGSTDGTLEWAQSQGYETYVQRQRGFRHAYHEVWPKIRGDVVVTFSPDGNSIPELLPDLIRKHQEGYNLVIASRYLPGAGSDDDDLVTGFGNWLFTRTINVLHRARYTDAMVIYRAFDTDLPQKLGLHDERPFALPERLFRTKISWEPLMSVRAARANCRTAEIAAREPARIGGERKLKVLKWGAAYYLQFIREVWAPRPVTVNSNFPPPDKGGQAKSGGHAKS